VTHWQRIRAMDEANAPDGPVYRFRGRPPTTRAMREEVARRLGLLPGGWRWIVCAYCDELIYVDWTGKRPRFLDRNGKSTPELDHVEPLYWGGDHTVENLVPACLRCNRSKGARRLA
jgi:5-methylcytosine-specific restriction endonuclease McrA